MRSGLIAAAGILVCGAYGVSDAAEVSEQGARELKSNLTHAVSDDLAKSGFISVKPAKDAYEVTFDLDRFLEKIASSDFSITGIKPLTMLVAPLANNLWNIQGNASVDVTAQSRLGRGPTTDISYSLGSLVYSGIFDPAISYLRSGDITAKDIKLSSTSGPQKIEVSAAGANYKLSAIDGSEPHRTDFHTTGNVPSFYEKISSPTAAQNMELRADSLDFDVRATGVPVKEVRDLAHFVIQHLKAKKLSEKGSDRFEALARAAMPLFVAFDETVTANNLTASTSTGNFGAKTLDYSVKMNGLVNAARMDVGMRLQDISLASGLVPAAYVPLVPSAVEFQIGVPDMNLADAANALLKSGVTRDKPLSSEERDRIGAMVFPGDAVTVDMPKLSAKSDVYDVEMSGKMKADLKQRGHYSLEATIFARDYDKSIAFVQNAAKTDAQLNQLSFGMMMAKGFAKTDPDGRQRWDIAVADDGSVTVNGQVMKQAGAN